MHMYTTASNANAAARKFVTKYEGLVTLAAVERAPGVTPMWYGGVTRVPGTKLTPEQEADITNTIRLLDAEPPAEEDEPAPAKKGRTKKTGAKPKSEGRVNKTQKAIEMVSRARGATNEELQAELDWQPHTVRGFISLLNKKRREEGKDEVSTVREKDKATRYILK